jgi:protein AATF/BFR2
LLENKYDDDDPFANAGSGESKSAELDEKDKEQEHTDSDNIYGLGHDPIAENDEIDSDEALVEGDADAFKGFVFGGSSTNKKLNGKLSDAEEMAKDVSSGETQNDDEEIDYLNDNGGDNVSSTTSSELPREEDAEHEASMSDESDSEGSEEESSRRAELRKMMNEEQKAVVATISEAAKADVEKGKAVRHQRKAFDSLLNIRIRLQKSVISANSLAATDSSTSHTGAPYHSAEEAALKLWNSLDMLRRDLAGANDVKVGQKRKRDISSSTTTLDIWDRLKETECPFIPIRHTVLEKWSSKVRGAAALPLSKKLSNASARQTITEVLRDQLSSDRLVKRSRMPRSCAPIQAAQKNVTEDPHIYDDADFYQLLLKELVDQRMADSTSTYVGGGIPQETVSTHLNAAREAKTKKNVDTKASKGRKMRYTVHEKLQNFMAPEDRGSWGQRQVDELFGCLFGRKMELGEGVDDVSEDDEERNHSEEALLLFRSNV